MNEKFDIAAFRGHAQGSQDLGPVHAAESGEVTVGEVGGHAELDPERLKASAGLEVTTVRTDGTATANGPGFSAAAHGYAQGPAAGAEGSVSPTGLDAEVGASAGEVGGEAGVDVLGEHLGFGGEVGAKAELGIHLGATSRIDLPFVSLEGPNPGFAAADYAYHAAKSIVEDPLGTIGGAAGDLKNTLEDGIDKIGGLFSSKGEDDDHSATKDGDWGGKLPPGHHPMD